MASISHTRSWDETDPVSGTAANTLHTVITNDLVDIRERMEIETDWNSATDSGRNKAGSARALIDLLANLPDDRTTTEIEGAGGNEGGRIFFGSDDKMLQVSDDTNWQPVIPNAHVSRHVDSDSAAAVDHDYIANIIKNIPVSAIIDASTHPSGGTDTDHGTVAITATGRRAATTHGFIIASGYIEAPTGSGVGIVGISTDATSANYVAGSRREMALNGGAGDPDRFAFTSIARVSALSAAVHTFHLVGTDTASVGFDVNDCILFALDLGVT